MLQKINALKSGDSCALVALLWKENVADKQNKKTLENTSWGAKIWPCHVKMQCVNIEALLRGMPPTLFKVGRGLDGGREQPNF